MLNLNKTVITVLFSIVNKGTSHSQDRAIIQDTARPISTQQNSKPRSRNGAAACELFIFFRPDMNDTLRKYGTVTQEGYGSLLRLGRVYFTNCHCHPINHVNNPQTGQQGVGVGRGEGSGCVPICEKNQHYQRKFAEFALFSLSH